MPDFIFVHYLLQSYRERLSRLVEQEEMALPVTQRDELLYLLDSRKLVRDRLRNLDEKLLFWSKRSEESRASQDRAIKLFDQGLPAEKVALEIEKFSPYAMKHVKSLRQLMQELPDELKRWELSEGSRRRVDLIWKPLLRAIQSEREFLKATYLSQS